jgi:hypothetical protein
MLRGLKTRLAKFLRAQAEIATEPRFAAILLQLQQTADRQTELLARMTGHQAELLARQTEVQHDLRGQIAEAQQGLRERIAEAQSDLLGRLTSEQAALLARITERQAELFAQQARGHAELQGQLATLLARIERAERSVDIERHDMEETQRMVGIACARIENFIKLQKEHRALIEQSVLAALPDRIRATEQA